MIDTTYVGCNEDYCYARDFIRWVKDKVLLGQEHLAQQYEKGED